MTVVSIWLAFIAVISLRNLPVCTCFYVLVFSFTSKKIIDITIKVGQAETFLINHLLQTNFEICNRSYLINNENNLFTASVDTDLGNEKSPVKEIWMQTIYEIISLFM